MAYEIIYERESGHILATRRSAMPREDMRPSEGQDKLFMVFDFGNRPMSAFRVDADSGELVLRDDWVEPEADVGLTLTVDAPATSPIDDLPEILADGESVAMITVQKISLVTKRPLTGVRHHNRLNIRTTAGTLSARQVYLDKGKATFTLRSSAETVVAELRVWAPDISGVLTTQIEFAPVE